MPSGRIHQNRLKMDRKIVARQGAPPADMSQSARTLHLKSAVPHVQQQIGTVGRALRD
jgi:hypothetical protein